MLLIVMSLHKHACTIVHYTPKCFNFKTSVKRFYVCGFSKATGNQHQLLGGKKKITIIICYSDIEFICFCACLFVYFAAKLPRDLLLDRNRLAELLHGIMYIIHIYNYKKNHGKEYVH